MKMKKINIQNKIQKIQIQDTVKIPMQKLIQKQIPKKNSQPLNIYMTVSQD